MHYATNKAFELDSFPAKKTVWQVAPWLMVPGGVGQGLPVPAREDDSEFCR